MTEQTTQITLQMPEDFMEKSLKVKAMAEALVVWDDEGYKAATDFASSCKAAINAIEKRRVAVKEPYKKAVEAIDSKAKELKKPFEEAMKIAQDLSYAYLREQERKKEEARQKALQEAAAERAKIKKQLEIEEAKVVETTTHEERIAQEAKVIDLKNQAQSVGAVTPMKETVKSNAGLTLKKKFKPEVVDMAAFIKWCAANVDTIPAVVTFLKVEQGKLNTFVNATQGAQKMDGVSINKVTSVSTRAKKGSGA